MGDGRPTQTLRRGVPSFSYLLYMTGRAHQVKVVVGDGLDHSRAGFPVRWQEMLAPV